jgi:hypothetical protein
MAMLSIQQDNRPPFASPESFVDAGDFILSLPLKVCVSLNMASRGRPDLNEGELFLVPWVSFEKRLYSQKPLDNAFGVVQPVNSNP